MSEEDFYTESHTVVMSVRGFVKEDEVVMQQWFSRINRSPKSLFN